MAEAPTQQGLLSNQSFGTIAPYEPNMVERAQGLLAQGFMKFGYDPRDAYFQANKIINTQGNVGAADFTPIAGDLIGAQDSYDMGVDAKRAFDREEYLKALGYGAGSAATGLLSGLGVLGTVVPPVDKGIDAVRAGVKKATGLLDDVDDLGFYSPTQRLATTLQEKGTGDQFLNILKKGDGKGARIQEEMQDMGLDTWLQGKGKVARDEVLDFIENNRLRYDKKVLGEGVTPKMLRAAKDHLGVTQAQLIDVAEEEGFGRVDAMNLPAKIRDGRQLIRDLPEAMQTWAHSYNNAWEDYNAASAGRGTSAKYQQYSQTGGTDYQENLLTVPRPDFVGVRNSLAAQKGITDRHIIRDYESWGSPEEIKKINKALDDRVDAPKYTSPHYDQANIGLTTRTQSFNTPDGNSVHLMDELQSDWHQAGKKKGYKSVENYKIVKDDGNVWRIRDLDGNRADIIPGGVVGFANKESAELALKQNIDRLSGVPNAPAKNSWINQGIKHELNNTIESGKDYFAWTGGDIQADRYSLSKQVKELRAQKHGDGTYSFGYIPPEGGNRRKLKTGVPDKELDGLIGKEMAEKVRKQTDETFDYVDADLEVGGEGMKGFYDKDVRKRTEKIIKQLDPNAKIEVIELDNGNKVWGVKITDKMRDKVKSEGMPLYSIAPIAGAGLLGAEMMRQEEQQPQQGILN